jgi:hypothetical protein
MFLVLCCCIQFIHEEALACELAAYFYLELEEINKSVEYFLLAHERYHEWVSSQVRFLSFYVLSNLLLISCLGSLSISSKGAIGKCNSLFKFVEGIIKERVGVCESSAIAHDVDTSSGPASSLYQRVGLQIDAELRRKRRVDDSNALEDR